MERGVLNRNNVEGGAEWGGNELVKHSRGWKSSKSQREVVERREGLRFNGGRRSRPKTEYVRRPTGKIQRFGGGGENDQVLMDEMGDGGGGSGRGGGVFRTEM